MASRRRPRKYLDTVNVVGWDDGTTEGEWMHAEYLVDSVCFDKYGDIFLGEKACRDLGIWLLLAAERIQATKIAAKQRKKT